jgi:clan AA aspartic protease
MITGTVNKQREAIILLAVHDAQSRIYDVEAVVDTGFNGDLTLPPDAVGRFQLRWLFRQHGVLADGGIEVFDVYEAIIEWDGQLRTVDVDAIDSVPLIGMRAMEGYELRIQVQTAGAVSIQQVQ